jgi:hypothetical protein
MKSTHEFASHAGRSGSSAAPIPGEPVTVAARTDRLERFEIDQTKPRIEPGFPGLGAFPSG